MFASTTSDDGKRSGAFLTEISRQIGAIEAGQGGRWSRGSISHDFDGGGRP